MHMRVFVVNVWSYKTYVEGGDRTGRVARNEFDLHAHFPE